MIVRAWRIVKAKHAAVAFTGEGAEEYGGRWNSPGVAIVYMSGSTALALLELIVHIKSPNVLPAYVLFDVQFDTRLMIAKDVPALPRTWRQSPAGPTTQHIGDTWVSEGRSAVLRVPSVIVPSEFNYLLNPAHRDFGKIGIGSKRTLTLAPRLRRP